MRMDDASGLALLVAAGALLCLSGAPGLLRRWRWLRIETLFRELFSW